MSVSGTGTTADHNGPLSAASCSHNVFASESEFLENLFIIEYQYQMDGFCSPKCYSFSAFASIENVQDWAAIFIWHVGHLDVEKWVNNFKHI